MSNVVILREDERELREVVCELLDDAGYTVVTVATVEELLEQAALRSPCVALIDGTGASSFEVWWLGPMLLQLGVPAVAFTAHASALQEFANDPHDFVAVISKPFDADELLDVVKNSCWKESTAAVS